MRKGEKGKGGADEEGFLLIEVLMTILILAVVFTAFIALLRQSLLVAERSRETTRAVSKYEAILFDLETGVRPDLVSYGGKGGLGEKFSYEMTPTLEEGMFYQLKSKVFWKNGKDFLSQDLFLTEAPVNG